MPRIVYNNRTGCFQVCLSKQTPPRGPNQCDPSKTCNVCPDCCHPWYNITQTDCDECVNTQCKY